jgi:hypothetical protein
MNQRIRELAEQAGAIEAKDITNIPRALSLNGEEIEEFAELIVQECAGRVDWILAEGGGTQGDLIREHFGVEL